MTNWKKVKISSFLKERESRIKPAEANNMGLKRLNKIDFSGKMHIVNKPTNTDMILIKNGDLVISGINVEKGAVAVYQGEEDIVATIHYSAYIFDETKIDIEYFKTFLRSKAFRDVINSQIRSGIKTELKANKFLPLEINLPDLETQIKIRDKINWSSNKILELSNINNKNEIYIFKLRQQILQDAVQGRLTKQDPKDEPASELLKKIKKEKEKLIKEGKLRKEKSLKLISEDEIPYKLPNTWEWVRLGDTQNYIQRGPSAKYSEKSDVQIINQKCIQWKKLLLNHTKYYSKDLIEKLADFRLLKKGDLLINSTGTGTIGRAFLIHDLNGKFIADSHVTVLRSFEGIVQEYVKYLFQTSKIQDFINNGGVGGSTNQIELSKAIISDFLFPLPPSSEQKRIVEKVDKLMTYCDELEKQVKVNKENGEKFMNAVLKESFENE